MPQRDDEQTVLDRDHILRMASVVQRCINYARMMHRTALTLERNLTDGSDQQGDAIALRAFAGEIAGWLNTELAVLAGEYELADSDDSQGVLTH